MFEEITVDIEDVECMFHIDIDTLVPIRMYAWREDLKKIPKWEYKMLLEENRDEETLEVADIKNYELGMNPLFMNMKHLSMVKRIWSYIEHNN